MANKYLTLAIVAFLGTSLLACRPTIPALTPDRAPTASATQSRVIVGRVDFSSLRQTQATVGDVLDRATVSLIDALTGETRTTAISDASGNFSLSMPGFVPITDGTYVVEAVKGLGAQLPGRTAPRLRTVVQHTPAGWLSLTNAAAGGAIVINKHTTALAIVSALDPIGLPALQAMGKVRATPPSALNAAPTWPSHPDSELDNLAADVETTLGRDDDPIATVDTIKPSLQGITPTSGSANQVISLTGSGFTGGTTTVKLGAMVVPSSNIFAITKNRIIFTVPVGASSGNVVVSTSRGGDSNGQPFTVPNSAAVSVQAISPNPARPAATVTITGTGFSTTLANNTINVNGINVTPTFANNTSLVFQVPSNATSGNVNVKVGPDTSNNYYLTIESLTTPQVSSLFPNVGSNKSIVSIKGQNFGPDGSVLIGDYRAKVISWSPNIIRAEVPWHASEGNQTVTVFAPLGIATQSFQVLDGDRINGWVNDTDMPAGVGGPGVHAYVGGEKLWVWGGVNQTNVVYMNLNADGTFKDAAWTNATAADPARFTLPEGTNQDDNPNSRVQILNRVYYTVTNNLAAANKGHMNFASLDPYNGDIIGFGYDPINDLPPTWAGKDLALVASDRYVYIMGHGASCTSDGVSCGNNPVGTMQARILESGNIGQWETGTNQFTYGEDGCPFIIGDSLYQIGGTSNSSVNTSQQSVLNTSGQMSSWRQMNPPLLASGSYVLSAQVTKIGRYYYYLHTWDSGKSYRGPIVDDLVPQPLVEIPADAPNASGVTLGLANVQVQVGRYLYLVSTNQGGSGATAKVVRGTIQ